MSIKSLGFYINRNASGIFLPLSAWKISSGDMTYQNLTGDELSLQVAEEYNDSPMFAYGDSIALVERWVDGAISDPATDDVVFIGKVKARNIDVKRGRVDYTVANVWSDSLETIVFERNTDGDASQTARSHIILNRSVSGDQITSGVQIKEILDFAISKGAPIIYIQVELDSLDIKLAADELSDRTCAECIIKTLKWHPDVTVSFDYPASGTGNTAIHFTKKEVAAAQSISVAKGQPIETFKIKRRDELKLDGVKIYFEKANQEDGEIVSTNVTIDTAGSPDGENVLVKTIELEGSYKNYESFTVEGIAMPSRPDWYYMTNVLWPHVFTQGGVYTWESGDGITYIGSNRGYALLNGSRDLPDWLKTDYAVSSCEVSIRWHREGWLEQRSQTWFITTNCPPGTYKQLVESSSGEAVPTGIAASLYAAMNSFLYEGTIKVRNAAKYLGNQSNGAPIYDTRIFNNLPTIAAKLNLTDGIAEWETMGSTVQSVTLDLFSNAATVKFGAPDQLGPQDYISLLENNRDRNKPDRISW